MSDESNYQQKRTSSDELRDYPPSVVSRFWSKVDMTGECWAWTAGKNEGGYGLFHPERGKCVRAHRFSYELTLGSIPKGAPLDHICHDPKECAGGDSCPHRSCVNPDHLSVSNNDENTSNGRSRHSNSYKTHCARGHEYSEENTLVWAGRRYCKTCTDEKNRIARSKRPPRSRLAEDDVREIRKLAHSGVRQSIISAQFGVTGSAVSAIVSGRTWKHVK